MSSDEQIQQERVDGAPEETSPGQIRPEGAQPGAPAAGSPGADPVSAEGDGTGVHTSDQGHPDLEGDGRSARDLGGPKAEEGAEGAEGTPEGAKGDIATKGMPPHE
jgi:hypothetical protein